MDYGSDGSLESRLYLSGAGSEDSGQYSCIMPGMEAVTPAAINISIGPFGTAAAPAGSSQARPAWACCYTCYVVRSLWSALTS